MNLGHLAVFHAIAGEGNVTRAAERLLVSQPAVSKQLKELERSVGASLFHRLPKGMRLTMAGEMLAGYATRIFALETEAQEAMEALRGLRRGRLVVGASNTIGVYLLPDVFVRFRRQYPGIQLQLEIAHSEVILRWLRRGDIHVGFVESAIQGDDIDSTLFASDRLVPIASPKHALAKKRSVTIRELVREPFVVRETGSGSKSVVEQALAQRRLSIKPVMSLGSTEAIKRAVAGGIGVAIVSELSIALEVKARTVTPLLVPGLEITRPLHCAVLRGTIPGPATQAFTKMVREAVTGGMKRVIQDRRVLTPKSGASGPVPG